MCKISLTFRRLVVPCSLGQGLLCWTQAPLKQSERLRMFIETVLRARCPGALAAGALKIGHVRASCPAGEGREGPVSPAPPHSLVPSEPFTHSISFNSQNNSFMETISFNSQNDSQKGGIVPLFS